jgi:putative transposase
MAKENRLWGAERIRGELLKLGLRVCKRTIQKDMRTVRTHQPRGQTWATDLEQPRRSGLGLRRAFWSLICSFDRSQAFFLIELKSGKVIHVGVTRSPTDAWVAHHLREATPYGQAPKYLICDPDSKFGSCFLRVATTSGMKLLKTPVHAKRPTAVCERFAQECQTRMSGPPADPAGEATQAACEIAYVTSFNQARPQEAHAAAATRLLWILSCHCAQRKQSACCSDLGWAAP